MADPDGKYANDFDVGVNVNEVVIDFPYAHCHDDFVRPRAAGAVGARLKERGGNRCTNASHSFPDQRARLR